jgi:hypothetical protein
VLRSAALLATFLATWLKAADGSKYLFGRSLVRPSSLAWFFVFGLFVHECFRPPLPAAVVSVKLDINTEINRGQHASLFDRRTHCYRSS